jgi:predicted enzyme related to lactoylglutathione lyase
MQKIFGLRTAIYQVNDINAAREWYTVAFNTEPYFNEPFYVGYNIGGYELGLHPSDDDVTGKTESVVAYWGVDNIAQSYESFLKAGALAYEKPTEVGGGIMVAKLKDPWNNIIGLIYNPHFSLPTTTP